MGSPPESDSLGGPELSSTAASALQALSLWQAFERVPWPSRGETSGESAGGGHRRRRGSVRTWRQSVASVQIHPPSGSGVPASPALWASTSERWSAFWLSPFRPDGGPVRQRGASLGVLYPAQLGGRLEPPQGQGAFAALRWSRCQPPQWAQELPGAGAWPATTPRPGTPLGQGLQRASAHCQASGCTLSQSRAEESWVRTLNLPHVSRRGWGRAATFRAGGLQARGPHCPLKPGARRGEVLALPPPLPSTASAAPQRGAQPGAPPPRHLLLLPASAAGAPQRQQSVRRAWQAGGARHVTRGLDILRERGWSLVGGRAAGAPLEPSRSQVRAGGVRAGGWGLQVQWCNHEGGEAGR